MTCFVEQKMIHEFALRFDDHLGFVELMELVSELPSGWEQCRQGIIAAMPQTPASAQWLKDADEFIGQNVKSDPVLRKWVHP